MCSMKVAYNEGGMVKEDEGNCERKMQIEDSNELQERPWEGEDEKQEELYDEDD